MSADEWGNRFPRKTKWNSDELFEILLKLNKLIGKNKKILDMGCGLGEAIYFFNKKGHSCVGADIKTYGVWSELNLNCVKYDSETFPFKNDEFDVVLLNNVFEHVSNKDKFSKEVKRVIKKNGKIIILLPTIKWKLSNLLNLPKYIIGGFLGNSFGTGYWFVHEPRIYGLNYISEFLTFKNWGKIIPRFFSVNQQFSMRNGKQLIFICK